MQTQAVESRTSTFPASAVTIRQSVIKRKSIKRVLHHPVQHHPIRRQNRMNKKKCMKDREAYIDYGLKGVPVVVMKGSVTNCNKLTTH